MKKLKYVLLGALVAAGMTSCDDLLDAPNQSSMSEDVIFSTEVLADAAVMGIHQSFCEQNSYRGRFITYFGTNNDAEIFNNYGGISDIIHDKEASLAAYSAQTDNSYMNTQNNVWAMLYEGIERANKAVESMEKYGNIDKDPNMGQLYGELLTLRAMIYYDLVKAWGDVPYRFSPISSETMYLPKTDRVTVLKKLMDDLLVAENYLGWPNENNYTKTTERVSKAFAKGLRARCALFLAGYSQWPTAVGDHTNSVLRYNLESAAERQQMYQIARDECADVIAQGCNVLGEFKDNFKRLCEENTTAGFESLFEIPFSEGRGRVCWTYGIKHGDADDWTKLASGGKIGPSPTLWYDYSPEDSRRDITCIPYQWKGGVKVVSGMSGGGWSFGKLRYEWMKRVVTSSNDDGINWQVMRLADIYLMAAEAENQLNGPAGAVKYLRPVVERAYSGQAAEAVIAKASASQQAFQQEIEDQRKFEFAGEALRKVDLMRWGKLGSKLAETKQKMTDLANREGEYVDYPEKVYFNEGLDAEATDADGFTIYGLEKGQTDAEGKQMFSENTRIFSLSGDPASNNDQKVNAYINNLYVNNPDSHMFWPIWKFFLDSSNGQLVNDYGY